MSSRSDEALLLAARRDADAFAELYRRHARPPAGFLVRRTGDAEAAADLLAETFAAALSGLDRFDPARGDAVSWLYGKHVVPILDTAKALALHGWKVGTVTSYPGAPLDSSCVDFFPGHSLAATQIAKQLGIANVLPASDLLRKAAGQDAGVVVIIGRDRVR